MQAQRIQRRPCCRQQTTRRGVSCPCTVRPVKGVLPVQRQHLRVAASAAPAAASSAPPETPKSWWKRAMEWWDFDKTENEKTKKTQKLSATLNMAWQLIASEKKLIGAAAFLMVAASLCELMIPHYTSKIIFAVTKQVPVDQFKQYLVRYSAFAIGFAVFAAARGAMFSVINNKLSRQLRYQLYGVLLREEAAFHDTNEPGQLTSRLTSDCYAITRCVATNVNVALRNMVQVIGGGVILLNLSPQLTGLCLAIFTALWGFTIMYGAYSRRAQRMVQDVLAGSTACAEEAFGSLKVVRTFGTEQREQDRYKIWLDKLYAVGMRQSAAWGLYLVAGTSAHHAALVLSMLLGGSMVYQGFITAEQLTSFMFYVQLVTASSLAVCDQYGAVMEAIGASERVLQHLNDPPAPQIAPGHLPSGTFKGEVELRNVHYTYSNRPDAPALTGVDLWLQPGKMTALVGPSGSGKSTLVALLQRLYDPTGGQVLIDGVDLTLLDAGWYRSRIGVVDQQPRLFSLTVKENILYGCPFSATQADVEDAARASNAHDFISALPKGYDTVVTDKLLSGGQRQRIALARALVRRPALLILDEATSALDAESEALVQQALDRAMKPEGNGGIPRTVLVIAHRLSTVHNAHTIVVLDKGKVAEQGTHADLVRKQGIYFNLVRRQQKGLVPQDRDLAPRKHDSPMLSSRDWDYGESGRPLQSRDGGAGITLRGITPLPDMVEGSSSANADSPRELLHQSGPSTPAQSSVVLSMDEEGETGVGADGIDGSAKPSVTWRRNAGQLQDPAGFVSNGNGAGRSQQEQVEHPGELSMKSVANDIVPLKSKISRERTKQPEQQEVRA